jgi:hypothetical protein
MTCFVQPEDDENPEGDDVGCDTQAEASTVKTSTATRTTEGDTYAKASVVEMVVADAVVTPHEAKIPQWLEV